MSCSWVSRRLLGCLTNLLKYSKSFCFVFNMNVAIWKVHHTHIQFIICFFQWLLYCDCLQNFTVFTTNYLCDQTSLAWLYYMHCMVTIFGGKKKICFTFRLNLWDFFEKVSEMSLLSVLNGCSVTFANRRSFIKAQKLSACNGSVSLDVFQSCLGKHKKSKGPQLEVWQPSGSPAFQVFPK